jgi:hypothetical protein
MDYLGATVSGTIGIFYQYPKQIPPASGSDYLASAPVYHTGSRATKAITYVPAPRLPRNYDKNMRLFGIV